MVADRAYSSIDKADRYVQTKQGFVIRLKDNIQVNRKRSLKRMPVVTNLRDITALIAYVLLKFLHTRSQLKSDVKALSFAGFTRLFL